VPEQSISYYTLEELIQQRENCRRFGMDDSDLTTEIRLVVGETLHRHSRPSIFDQDA
jgi:hypothetical protein